MINETIIKKNIGDIVWQYVLCGINRKRSNCLIATNTIKNRHYIFKSKKEILNSTPLPYKDYAQIIEALAGVLGFEMKDLVEARRKSIDAVYRDIIIYYMRKHTDITFYNLGEIFKKDHSSIVNSYKNVSLVLDDKIASKNRLDAYNAIYNKCYSFIEFVIKSQQGYQLNSSFEHL